MTDERSRSSRRKMHKVTRPEHKAGLITEAGRLQKMIDGAFAIVEEMMEKQYDLFQQIEREDWIEQACSQPIDAEYLEPKRKEKR